MMSSGNCWGDFWDDLVDVFLFTAPNIVTPKIVTRMLWENMPKPPLY